MCCTYAMHLSWLWRLVSTGGAVVDGGDTSVDSGAADGGTAQPAVPAPTRRRRRWHWYRVKIVTSNGRAFYRCAVCAGVQQLLMSHGTAAVDYAVRCSGVTVAGLAMSRDVHG